MLWGALSKSYEGSLGVRLLVGENIRSLGRWKLIEKIDHGGSSNVWKGISDDQEVALKILQRRAYQRPNRYQRFKAEVETLRNLTGRTGILPVLDAHIPDRPTEADPPWLATPLAEPLSRVCSEELSLRNAVEICVAVGRALCEVHVLIGAHRDIKPENLFRYRGTWCVGDFGLVSLGLDHRVTQPGERLGPTFYIAPEMLNDATEYDGKAADVYSLAKVLWKLGTGQNYPLQGTLYQADPRARLSTYLSDPKATELDGLLERATAIEPSARPVSRITYNA